MRHPGKTPPFRGSSGEPAPDSIAEAADLKLGGTAQRVMIRGESLSNPPLILLHGGPGLSDTPFFRRFNAPLEKAFTVVYWEQRGTGRSFDPAIPRASMTVERFVADLAELVEIVCRRAEKPRVALLGHSWGSALGALYAARFPERVAVYVGCAQVGDWAAAESASYALALAEAERVADRKVLTRLRDIGPPPHGFRGLLAERTCWARLDGMVGVRGLWSLGKIFLGWPEASVFDLRSTLRGFRFTLDAMWPEVSTLNLVRLVPELRMPVLFFLGRKDHWIPPETSVAYFEALAAPSKELVWFERSGHEPFADEPEKFNASMLERVRPLAA